MAYIQNNEEEEDVIDQPVTTGQGGSLLTSTPGSGSATNGTTGASAKTPGNFVGINEYINANKAQTGRLANSVADTVEGDITQAKDTLNQNVDQVNWQVGEQRHKFGGDLRDQIKSSDDPYALESVIKASDTTYKGPNDFMGTNEGITAKQGIDKAQNTADLSKTESGLSTIMGKMNPGQGTKGTSMLDTALLKSDPNARQDIAQARQPVGELGQLFNTADTKIKANADQTRQNNQKTGEMVRSFVKDWRAQPIQATQQAIQQSTDMADSVQGKIQKGDFNLSPDELNSIGVTPEQWKGLSERLKTTFDNVYGGNWDLNQFLIKSAPAITTGSKGMSDDEYARISALYKAAGVEPPAREGAAKQATVGSAMKLDIPKLETWMQNYMDNALKNPSNTQSGKQAKDFNPNPPPPAPQAPQNTPNEAVNKAIRDSIFGRR